MPASAGLPDPFSGVDWGLVWEQATQLARIRVRPQDVDDLVTLGLERVLGGQALWDPSRGRPLSAYVVDVGYNALREQWRKASRPHDPAFVSKFLASLEPAAANPEDVVLEAELNHRNERLFGRLQVAFAGDRDADAVIECEAMGIHEPAAQAARTGLGIDAVRNARKRIKRRAFELFAEDEKEGPRS